MTPSITAEQRARIARKTIEVRPAVLVFLWLLGLASGLVIGAIGMDMLSRAHCHMDGYVNLAGEIFKCESLTENGNG